MALKTVFRSLTVQNAIRLNDPDYINPPSVGSQKEDRFLKDYLIEKGRGGIPDVISKKEMDDYVKKGDRELYRGLREQPIYCDYFRYGPLFVGLGNFGNGIYTAYGVNASGYSALEVARGYGPYILRMCLKANAKVVTFDEISEVWAETGIKIDRQLRDLENATGNPILINQAIKNRKDYKLIILSDHGRFAATFGYDAIDIEQHNEMVVLNRTAVRVQDKNVE